MKRVRWQAREHQHRCPCRDSRGIGVLVMGLLFVVRETLFQPYTLFIFIIIVIWLALIEITPVLISNRTDKPCDR